MTLALNIINMNIYNIIFFFFFISEEGTSRPKNKENIKKPTTHCSYKEVGGVSKKLGQFQKERCPEIVCDERYYCVFLQQVVSGQTVQQVVSGQQIQTVASAQQTQQVVAAQPSLVTVPAATATTQVKPPTPLNQAVPAPPSSTNASADNTAPVSLWWFRKICLF